MILYFFVLIISIIVGAVYYYSNRKDLNMNDIIISSILCYITSLVLLFFVLDIINYVHRYSIPLYYQEGIVVFLPIILGINIPLFITAIRNVLAKQK